MSVTTKVATYVIILRICTYLIIVNPCCTVSCLLTLQLCSSCGFMLAICSGTFDCISCSNLEDIGWLPVYSFLPCCWYPSCSFVAAKSCSSTLTMPQSLSGSVYLLSTVKFTSYVDPAFSKICGEVT